MNNEYIYGVQCGEDNCYACATQRYNCPELDEKDKMVETHNGLGGE